MRLISRIVCAFKGHKRGKRIDGPRQAQINGALQTIVVYKCPRCEESWHRKVKAT